eukprot:CAMPEP_0194763780 /NCGR_PEP_ID=MMETSP0323_2-20130528/20521_1 /TAXON_ID=2866 ORGANISM="Crypthecodinium cohnii, Strain Seligo" /NCGR_SAMPLE_ID=MMETSP0323_2 /ASSEMBLY_ACC=CAM_ASM_000346 /LENGTH=45 /DNA_ID= /DNA_START= /DNA_END= /DNA_ORIENTATION=
MTRTKEEVSQDKERVEDIKGRRSNTKSAALKALEASSTATASGCG